MASPDEQVPASDFYTFLTPYVADAPDDVIDHAVREAIIWFCRESRVLDDRVTVRLQRNVHEYALRIPEGRQLIALDWAREFLLRLQRGPFLNITEHFLQDIFGTGGFHPKWHKDGAFPVVEFPYGPRRSCARELWYSWVPNRDFCGVPRLLYEDYMEAIRTRALFNLYMMPKTDWYDPQLADTNRLLAEEELNKARSRRYANYTQGMRKMRGVPFVRRGSYIYGGPYGGGMS